MATRLQHVPPRVDWITLAVRDPQRSRAFYEALGFGPGRERGEHFLLYDLEPGILALIGAERLSEETGVSAGTPGAVLLSRNLPSEEAVHGMVRRLIDAGGTATRETGATPWGTVSGWMLDPDGHPWEICFNPHTQEPSQEESTT